MGFPSAFVSSVQPGSSIPGRRSFPIRPHPVRLHPVRPHPVRPHPVRPHPGRCYPCRGFTLVSALVGVLLITGLIVFMLSLSVHFHRMNRESLSGTQMEMVLDAVVNAYVWQRQTSPLKRYYHVTNAGILPAGEATGSGDVSLPPPPDVLWVDTIEVSVWREDVGHGVRTWGVCTSQRSRRGSTTVRYSPKLD